MIKQVALLDPSVFLGLIASCCIGKDLHCTAAGFWCSESAQMLHEGKALLHIWLLKCLSDYRVICGTYIRTFIATGSLVYITDSETFVPSKKLWLIKPI